MSHNTSCEEIQELASEVALGIAAGDERAKVLAHSRTCSNCRHLIEELSETADVLLLVGPTREPPSGFESDVLARIQSAGQQRPRRRWLGVAAALVAVMVGGAATLWATAEQRRVGAHYQEVLAEANGKYFGVVSMRGPGGDQGRMFVYRGNPSWVFLISETPMAPGTYEAEIETTDGEVRSLGSFQMDDGDLTWGSDLPVDLRSVEALTILDDTGRVALEATFSDR